MRLICTVSTQLPLSKHELVVTHIMIPITAPPTINITTLFTTPQDTTVPQETATDSEATTSTLATTDL